ncbi:MAG: hypothetical protein BWY20_01875 [Spirochaetes bacterium ADurb.Bin215]|nr:MAG: hypothetical protein BWY20_01875 [Spirochaetes bacterium ADurb.Bin215]
MLPFYPYFLEFIAELSYFIANQSGPLVVLVLNQFPFFPAERGNSLFQFFQFRGSDVSLDFFHGAGFIKNVYRLVREKTVGEITARKGYDCLKSIVGIPHMMMALIPVFYSCEDLQGIVRRGFLNLDGLEAAFQGGVFLEIFAVFGKGRRSDTLEISPGKRRFEHVGRIHCAFRAARSDNGVQFVNK